MTCLLHDAKSLHTFLFLGFSGLFRLDSEALLTSFDALLRELLRHNAKSSRTLHLFSLLLLEELKSFHSRRGSLDARDPALAAEASKTKLLALLLRELTHLLHTILG